MKTPTWLSEKVVTLDGIDYYLAFEPDDLNPRTHFITQCEWAETDYNEIKNYYWFSARVLAMKGQFLLSETYMGGNCYKNKKEVISGDNWRDYLGGYMGQMVDECKEEAEEKLSSLILELTA